MSKNYLEQYIESELENLDDVDINERVSVGQADLARKQERKKVLERILSIINHTETPEYYKNSLEVMK